MTNYDRIMNMSIEELAVSRIDSIGLYIGCGFDGWVGDFRGIADSEQEAIWLELEWLRSEQ